MIGLAAKGAAAVVTVGVAPGAGAGLAGRFGGSSSSIAWTWNSSITSAVWRRNSAIALPSERATSGSRFGPSTTSATTRITSSSGIPIPNIGRERREKGGRCQFTAHDPSAIVRAMAGGTAVVVDRRMLAHDPGRGHPERPDRLRVLLDHLGDARDLVHLGARAAAEEELALVHPAAHIERVAASAGRAHVVFDPDTATSAGSWDAACLAAGSLLVLCEAILAGEVANGFALVRPPGHHAERDRAMGFCLFNNVAVAAAHARAGGARKVAIVDYDVHHGNGTQHIFERDAGVLYISTHQYPYYPGTGAADEIGIEGGRGYTVNVPIAAGAVDDDYQLVFSKVIMPILLQSEPDLV